MSGRNTVLIVEARGENRRSLERMLATQGRHLVAVESRTLALKAMALNPVSVIVTASSLPDGNWRDFISHTAEEPVAPNVIVVTLEAREAPNPEAMQLGAYAVLAGPEAANEIPRMVDTAVQDWERRRKPMQWAMCAAEGFAGPVSSGDGREAAPASAWHVLVVDDERAILSLVAAILQNYGFRVSTAENGMQAIEVARREGIQLVLLDWRMPGMSGEQILDQLAAIRPESKVVVVSGSAASDVTSAFEGRRVDGFLYKPFTPETLLRAVRDAVSVESPPARYARPRGAETDLGRRKYGGG